MDPFTQRMLERARARQEKIDQKLASTGQTPKRRPLVENTLLKSETPVKSPAKSTRETVLSPKKSIKEVVKSPIRSPVRKSVPKPEQAASAQSQNDFIMTKKEYKTPKRISNSKRNSDVSVEINIMHRDDIQIEVQVEERDAPMTVIYDSASSSSNVVIKEIEEDTSKKMITDSSSEHRAERSGLRHNVKSQLDRLGVLYSDNRDLSSPIHRTELEFSSATPPDRDTPRPARAQAAGAGGEGKRKFGRLAALADQINNWEDDLTHHGHTEPPATKKPAKPWKPEKAADQSTLDVSIHSLHDINKALKATAKESSKPINSRTYTKPTNIELQALHKNIVAELVLTTLRCSECASILEPNSHARPPRILTLGISMKMNSDNANN